jgi:hypothetical protein
MKRQPEREQLNRLTVKTLDQVFIMRVKEGLGCSQFEALTGLVVIFRAAIPLPVFAMGSIPHTVPACGPSATLRAGLSHDWATHDVLPIYRRLC